MKPYLICPTCGSDDVMKNGMTRRAKQNHKCRECGRQFVENPQWTPKDTDTLAKIELLLLERISLAGIARVMGVSESWLQNYVNHLYGAIELKATVIPKEVGKHTVQMDELWSFVDGKGNKQWVWLAMDTKTREVTRMSSWRPLCEIGSWIMGFTTECLSPMCQDLYRSLGSLCRSFTK